MSWVLIIIMGVSYGGSAIAERFETEEACLAALQSIKMQVDPTGSKFAKDALEVYGGCYRSSHKSS